MPGSDRGGGVYDVMAASRQFLGEVVAADAKETGLGSVAEEEKVDKSYLAPTASTTWIVGVG